MVLGCNIILKRKKNIRDMKNLKIWSLIALFALAMSACDKAPNNSVVPPQQNGNLDAIEQEWKLVSVNETPADFNVYMSFSAGMFSIYQQVYTLNYQLFEGQYEVNGNTLSGSYYDEGAWKCDYTGGISEDGKTMTLVSNQEHPVTYVYEACTIPDIVREEASQTRSVGVVPFL